MYDIWWASKRKWHWLVNLRFHDEEWSDFARLIFWNQWFVLLKQSCLPVLIFANFRCIFYQLSKRNIFYLFWRLFFLWRRKINCHDVFIFDAQVKENGIRMWSCVILIKNDLALHDISSEIGDLSSLNKVIYHL